MSEDGKRIENLYQLYQLCLERHVPYNRIFQWVEKVLELSDRESQEKRAAEKIEYVKQHYPPITAECFLARIEKSRNWEKLKSKMYIYWEDIPSLLRDAVRTGSARTVKQLAFHVLFDNKELQEELLRLAPDEKTRKALRSPTRVRREAYYRRYPFCIRENDIENDGIWVFNKTILTLPDNAQQVAFDRLIQRFGSQQKLLERARTIGPEECGGFLLADALYGLGCDLTDKGFVFRKLPEYWMESEYGKNIRHYANYSLGLMGLRRYLSEYEFRFDGLHNLFGRTGYCYLEKWP